MHTARRCNVADCSAVATDRCFECGVWCCDEHRSTVQVPTSTIPFREDLCATCLQVHIATSDRYGPVAIELPLPGKGSTGAGTADLEM